ncbi:MAG: pilin [Patescibacteria group bacterium]
MKKSIKNIIGLFLSFLIIFVIGSKLCLAAGFDTNLLDSIPTNSTNTTAKTIAQNSGYSTSVAATDIFSRVIQIVLGLSGTIALVLVIISGILYLLSKGDPAKIKKALAYMTTGFIGILLMTSAYAISGYIIKQTRRISGIVDSTPPVNVNQEDIDKCSKLSGMLNCIADSSCSYLNDKCIVKASLAVGDSCDADSQCSTGTCHNDICIVAQQSSCLPGSYSPATGYTKQSLKNNLNKDSDLLCKSGFIASSVGDATDSNCKISGENSQTGYSLKGIQYTCSDGSTSDNCYICVRRECSEVVLATTCGSETAYNKAYADCKWVTDQGTGTSHCVDK